MNKKTKKKEENNYSCLEFDSQEIKIQKKLFLKETINDFS